MALAGLGLFLLEAAAGTSFLLLFFPPGTLGKGFFSLHGTLAFAFVFLAVLARPAGLPMPVAVAAALLLAIYAIAAHAGRPGPARPLLALSSLCACWSLWRVALVSPAPGGDVWTGAGALLGGLFLGAVLLAMNLGHWYLISRSLPFRLLARAAGLFAWAAAARAALLAAALLLAPSREGLASLLSLERDALFFLFRVLWGIVGPLTLSYFVWRTAEMKSNQAATGLLYVALVFVLIGELLSSYLTVATGFPA